MNIFANPVFQYGDAIPEKPGMKIPSVSMFLIVHSNLLPSDQY